ncbi:MAG: hypothetical protein BWY51_00354 [Parcubacteria group bacterium ADurb.Bin316]|nr:MAG: hypothetical protein BWY51_00354 [Parcubacteria group bacterium ADurb.Bin316]HOZ56491.1 hypothetical protein [bacterium]
MLQLITKNKKIFVKTSIQFFLIFLLVFLFSMGDYSQLVEAVSGNYSKVDGNNLTRDDWNVLDEDFVDREGDTMGTNLNLNNHRIVGVNTNPANSSDLANVGYIDSLLVSSQGGYVYTNWGRSNCSGSDTLLYSGFGFNSIYTVISGGSNNICIQLPFNATSSFVYALNSNSRTDGLYPLMTSDPSQLPPEMSTMYRNYIECAVCFRRNSSCIESVGSFNCTMPGFNYKAYDGYVLGGEIPGSHYHSQERICVNRSMHINTNSAPYGAVAYGSRIRNNFGMSEYGIDRFIPCAVCCNN